MSLDYISLVQLRRPLRPLSAPTSMCFRKLTHFLACKFNTLTQDNRILFRTGPANFLVLVDRNFRPQPVGAMTCNSLLPDVPVSSVVLESFKESGSLTDLCVLCFYESKHVLFAITVFSLSFWMISVLRCLRTLYSYQHSAFLTPQGGFCWPGLHVDCV